MSKELSDLLELLLYIPIAVPVAFGVYTVYLANEREKELSRQRDLPQAMYSKPEHHESNYINLV